MPSSRPDLYAEVTDRIVAALEAGTTPWVCPWDRTGGRPRNGITGRVYQGINTFLLALTGHGDPRWCTYRQAQANGGQVRKGEKGTRVIFWKFIDAKDDRESDEQKRPRSIPLLRHFTVFNFTQIDWPEDSGLAQKPASSIDQETGFEAAARLVQTTKATITHGGVRACYSPLTDRIMVPNKERFETSGDYWATVLHELAHWTGKEGRCSRDLTGRFGSESYAAEELVAELAAAFLCADLQVPGNLRHAEYIGAWVKILRSDNKAIFSAARLAQEAANYLLGLQVQGGLQAVGEAA